MDKLAASRRRGRRPDPAHLAVTDVRGERDRASSVPLGKRHRGSRLRLRRRRGERMAEADTGRPPPVVF